MHSVFKDGKYGPYFDLPEEGSPYPDCGAETRLQKGLFGSFYGCVRYPKVQRYCENSTGETSTVTRSVLTLAHAQLKGLDCRRSRSRPVAGHPLEINCHHAIPKSQPKLDVRFVGILQGEN